MLLKEARAAAAAFEVRTLLADALANPKVAKSADVAGVLTAPLHLAPAASSGVMNVCPFAGACEAPCLDGSGNPAYAAGKQRARINRTRFYKAARGAFMVMLVAELAAHIAAARRANMEPAARLNATSDILWERIPVTVGADLSAHIARHYGQTIAAGDYANIMGVFPALRFYDYTKIPPRHRAGRLPANYTLTYSYDPANDPADLRAALALGWNVAAPFQVKRGKALPARYTIAGADVPVIDGDVHDYRPADPSGVIVGLRFKRITDKARAARLGAAASTGAGFALPV